MVEFKVVKEDITKLTVDTIVNAANSNLLRGSGVCGAIFRAAGPELDEECHSIGHCSTGDAVITKGYNLPFLHIIHAVGPIYEQDKKNAASLLASAYSRALCLAEDHQISSIAFPCISTGVYGYPKEDAAKIAVTTCKENQFKHIKQIVFCCFDEQSFKIYNSLLRQY